MKFPKGLPIHCLLPLILFLCSCSLFKSNPIIQSGRERNDQETTLLSKAKGDLLEKKTSLRVAELRVERLANGKNTNVILETSFISFLTDQEGPWSLKDLAGLHGELLPEFYGLLTTIKRKNFLLHVLCLEKASCQLLKLNLSQKEIEDIRWYDPKNQKELKFVKPALVLSGQTGPFDEFTSVSFWRGWKRKWIYLDKSDSMTQINPVDWSEVVSTLNKF